MAANMMTQLYIKTFEGNIIQLAQQKFSKLRRTVTERSGPTAVHRFQVMSARGAMTQKSAPAGTNTNKRNATPWADSVFNNRIATPLPYHTADSYEWDDVVRQHTDPQSALTTSLAAQAGRRFDDTIIAAATAAALDDLANSNAHPAGSQLGGATTAFDFDLVRATRELILEKDIDPDEEVFFVISPNAVMALLDDAKATSIDYANAKALMGGGLVQGWMGFSWIVSNRLTDPAPTSSQRYALAYTKDAIGLVVAKEPFVKIAEDPGASFATTVYLGVDLGAVRVQDEKMLRVHYLES